MADLGATGVSEEELVDSDVGLGASSFASDASTFAVSSLGSDGTDSLFSPAGALRGVACGGGWFDGWGWLEGRGSAAGVVAEGGPTAAAAGAEGAEGGAGVAAELVAGW